MYRLLVTVILFFIVFPISLFSKIEGEEKALNAVKSLEKPLYSVFIERYVLDKLKQLQTDQAQIKQELIPQIVDREHYSVDRAVSYATDRVTYFFYLIAAATSVLVLVGWTSIRDIKERVHSLAGEKVSKLVHEYEKHLATIENQLKQNTENLEEIGLTQDVQSLWLRAPQDSFPAKKIIICDEILKLRHDDCEALTYKTDAVLESSESQWAANLCHQTLHIEPDNSHAFYRLACTYNAIEQFDEALRFLVEAINRRDIYLQDICKDPAPQSLVNDEKFKELTNLINIPQSTSNGQAPRGLITK
jgi:tetratricopeptide (TPR) repeat protein